MEVQKRQKQKPQSLRKNLVKLCIFGMSTLGIISILVGVITSYNGLLVNVNKDLSTIVKTSDVAVAQQLNDIRYDASQVTSVNLDYSLESKNLDKLDSFCKNSDNEFQAGAIVSTAGTVASNDDVLKAANVSNDVYFQQAVKTGKVVIGTTVVNGSSVYIPVYVPINDGKQIAALRMTGETFCKELKNIRVGDTGNVFMLDKEGSIISNMRPALVNSRANFINDAKTDSSKAESAKVYSEMVAGKSGTDRYAYAGVERVCAFQPVTDGNGWSICAVAPIQEMTSSIYTTALTMLLIIVAVAVAFEFWMGRRMRKITVPIIAAADRLTQMASGDLHTPTPTTDAIDETGTLLKELDVLRSRMELVVNEISRYLAEIAKGNLNMQSPRQYLGDFEEVSTSITTILDSLNNAMQQIDQSSAEVNSGSDQISAGAQALSQGATEQASAIEELAATIQEISKEVAENTQNANEAAERATETATELVSGQADMQKMMSAMQDISDSSAQIGKIIKSIEDIAFQTNILALNAAVEAARAGEAGKGFAVVADEVRNLANKSQAASQETTKMIERSVASVDAGTQIVNATAASMERIVSASGASTELVRKISAASQEQDSAIQQVTVGVDQISSVIQTNSATAEESAAASEELSSQAAMLKNLVQFFHLRGGSNAVQPSAAEQPSYERYQAAEKPSGGVHRHDKY